MNEPETLPHCESGALTMAYFVTGATGFIGRFLVQELVDNREGEIFALCREGSRDRLERLIEEWGTDRVTPVIGDLGEPDLGIDHRVDRGARAATSSTSSTSPRSTT